MDKLTVPISSMNGNMNGEMKVRIFLFANYIFSCNIVRQTVIHLTKNENH